jgi:hypothetical protein
MRRREVLWLAFEKFAIFFSFAVTFVLVMILLVAAYTTWQAWPMISALRGDLACPMIADVNELVDDLGNAVITRTIPISQTIPVVFDLPLDKNLNVTLTEAVNLSRPTSFVLPAGGGRINGTVYLALPQGQNLPVHMSLNVPVRETIPVQMDVNVAIPLDETELGPVVDKLKGLLMPYMDLLSDTLKCKEPQAGG